MLLSVAAVLVVGAFASASASAANDPCPTEESTGTEFDLCAEKSPTESAFVELGSGEPPVTNNFGTDGVQTVETKLKGKLAGVVAEFKCKKIDVKLEIEDSNKGKGNVNFSECEMTKPAGCKLTALQEAEIKVPVVTTIDEEGAGKIGTEFWGKTGGPTKEEEEFVTLNVEAKAGQECIAVGAFSVTGSQWSEVINATTAKEHGEASVLAANSELKLGGNAATFESVGNIKNLEPASDGGFGELWKIVKSKAS
jgi:hypothetical protein